MNYTTININGKDVGLKFGMLANEMFFNKTNNDVFKGEYLTSAGIPILLHSAYVNNCVVKEMKPELTLENFFDYVELKTVSGDAKEITDAVNMWSESRLLKKAIEETKGAKKKIGTGTKSGK